MQPTVRVAVALLALLLAACASGPVPDYRAVLGSADRTDADRVVDRRRNSEQLLAFIGARPRMRVLEMGADGGYTAELLTRIVGADGVVYAQDTSGTLPRILQAYEERAKKPVMKNVVRLLRPYDDPVPAEANNLDLITFLFAYHDTTYMQVDRAKMNRALFNALKPGGRLVIADHSAVAGAGIGVARTLHRIEQSVLQREIEAAGFQLEAETEFLRNPWDPRTDRIFGANVAVDQFVFRYRKP